MKTPLALQLAEEVTALYYENEHLRYENARLKEQVNRYAEMVNRDIEFGRQQIAAILFSCLDNHEKAIEILERNEQKHES